MPSPEFASPAPPSGTLSVLAVEPFYGGSHRAFLDSVVRHSRHRWSLVTGAAVHWKWRMRSAPLSLADQSDRHVRAAGPPDVILCSDMLDLPQWLGLVRDHRLSQTPIAVYFHENQLTYPQSPDTRVDFHFGYSNILTAIRADVCLFNSAFHRDDFIAAARTLIARMPDGHDSHDLDAVGAKAEVVYPGFRPTVTGETTPEPPPGHRDHGRNDHGRNDHDGRLTIGWVSRWEYDKRPDKFASALQSIRDRGVDFRLLLLGPRPHKAPPALQQIRQEFGQQIMFDGFAESRDQYARQLSQMDVVVSTADHEFFGIAICEAVWAGAMPLLPTRQSYPELFPACALYGSDPSEPAALAARVAATADDGRARRQHAAACRDAIRSLQSPVATQVLDDCLQRLGQ